MKHFTWWLTGLTILLGLMDACVISQQDCEEKTDPVWMMENGVVIIEIESAVNGGDSTGYWEKLTVPPGYTGNCAYIWTGEGNMYKDPLARDAPGTGIPYTLSYKIWVPEEGEYEIKLHNLHHMKDGDNDAWISINNGLYEKIWDHDEDIWSWNEAIAWEKGYQPRVFIAGTNTIEITGRSKGWAIDRLVIYKKGTPEANWKALNLPESSIANNPDFGISDYVPEPRLGYQVADAASIQWKAAREPGISTYQVLLNDVVAGSTHLNCFTVAGLEIEQQNQVLVKALDQCGNPFAFSEPFLINDPVYSKETVLRIRHFKEPCKIDGSIDEAWESAITYTLSAPLGENPKAILADGARFSMAWDESKLYVLFVVQNLNPERFDLYLDPDNSKDPFLSIHDRWYVMEPLKGKMGERLDRDVNAMDVAFASSIEETTSIMEASIPWERLQVHPTLNARIGLEILFAGSNISSDSILTSHWFRHNYSENPVPAQFGTAQLVQ